MKVQTKAVIALAIASSASAFAPTTPMVSRPSAPVAVEMAKDGEMNMVDNLGKAALSLMTASALAFSTSTMVLPVEAAYAKAAPAPEVVVDKKAAKKASEAKTKADAEKALIAKMGKEEKEVYMAKKDLSLSENSLKEYQKFVSDAKGAQSKAENSLKSQVKATEKAKKDLEEASKKLQGAKKLKLPGSAISELTAIECTYEKTDESSCMMGRLQSNLVAFGSDKTHITSFSFFCHLQPPRRPLFLLKNPSSSKPVPPRPQLKSN